MSNTVPATPVVSIEILDDVVKVNGEVVNHDGTRSLNQVGVHAAATRVAAVLGRPVRAIATDASTRTAMVVHPNGTASDFEILPDTVLVERSLRDKDPATAAGAQLVHVPGNPARSGRRFALLRRRLSSLSGRVRMPSIPGRLVAVVALGVLVVVGLIGAATLLTSGGDPSHASTPATTEMPSTTPAPTPVAVAQPLRVVGKATAKGKVLTLRAKASRGPVVAVVTVIRAKGEAVTRRVRLTTVAKVIRFGDLAPGRVAWLITAEGTSARGHVRIAKPTPEPKPPLTSSSSSGSGSSTGSGTSGTGKPPKHHSGPKGPVDPAEHH